MIDHKKNAINILGIDISLLKKEAMEAIIKSSLTEKRRLFITTPNPEIILNSDKDEELFHILNNSDLAIADGIGLKFAAWMMGRNIFRWPGSQITPWLLEQAQKNGYKVAILNLKEGLSSKKDIERAILEKFPKLKYIIEPIDKDWSMPFYQALNLFEPDIVLVGLGSPSQEKFIYHNILKLPFVKIAMGVGGSFDYLTGKIKPAPAIFRSIGLEWLWRLINILNFTLAAKRCRRIANAVILFPLKFLKWLVVNPFFYRKNVACLLFRKGVDSFEILILERSDEPGHYQLPQGGVDGQSLLKAGTRELQEEIGTYKFTPIKTYSNLYKYKYKNTDGRGFRNYKGQNQGLLIANFIGKDQDIKINYWEFKSWKWVPIDIFINSVHPVRRESAKKFYEKIIQLDLK